MSPDGPIVCIHCGLTKLCVRGGEWLIAKSTKYVVFLSILTLDIVTYKAPLIVWMYYR